MSRSVMPGAPAKDPICLCRQADHPVQQRLTAATGWTLLDWCWGHGLGSPLWARPPYLYLEAKLPVAIRLADRLHSDVYTPKPARQLTYAWALIGLFERSQLRWKLTAPLLEDMPLWNITAVRRDLDIIITWMAAARTDSSGAQRLPQQPQEQDQQQWQDNKPQDCIGWPNGAMHGTADDPIAQALISDRTSPHNPLIDNIVFQQAHVKMLGTLGLPRRYRLACWVIRHALSLLRTAPQDILPMIPWWESDPDPQVRPLLAAFSLFDEIRTYGSCEGHLLRQAPPYIGFAAPVDVAGTLAHAIEQACRAMPPLLWYPWRITGWIFPQGTVEWSLDSPLLTRRPLWRPSRLKLDLMTLAMLVSKTAVSQKARSSSADAPEAPDFSPEHLTTTAAHGRAIDDRTVSADPTGMPAYCTTRERRQDAPELDGLGGLSAQP